MRVKKSAAILEQVQQARQVQHKRFEHSKHLFCNADMQSRDIRKHCKVDEQGQELLKMANGDYPVGPLRPRLR